ncbi:MAG: hypothetical protein Q7S33_02180 [Nanoarchaeota archaeon]|nr:hypothetical protein [Nanoarchaeota archaeon]
MIKIVPTDVEGMYQKLVDIKTSHEMQSASLDFLLGMMNKEQNITTQIPAKTTILPKEKHFSFEGTLLPSPLESISGGMYSNGINYHGRFLICLEDYTKYHEFLKKIASKFPDELNFGKSLLFCLNEGLPEDIRNKTPYFELSKSSGHSWLGFSFGESGTAKRNLSSLPDFKSDMDYTTKILTKIINSCYDKELPDLELPLYF